MPEKHTLNRQHVLCIEFQLDSIVNAELNGSQLVSLPLQLHQQLCTGLRIDEEWGMSRENKILISL